METGGCRVHAELPHHQQQAWRQQMPENEKLDETLRALCLVLEKLKVSSEPLEVDKRRHFYNMFNREADEYDRDFHQKYHDDLNTTLIFAGLFSAVASAFIIDIQQELRPDYNEMSFTVLTMLLNATSGTPNQLDVPVPSDPKASAVQVQSILFGSLASALLAAFMAMLGKQWLNLHVQGSLIDRSRHRELKMRGMIIWRFKDIMEYLPIVMQLSLALLGYALARYMWDLNRTVSAVITAFTVLGTLFYTVILYAATVYKTCPFQTPVSLNLRQAISLARKYQHHLLRKLRDQLTGIISSSRRPGGPPATTILGRPIDQVLALGPVPPPDTSIPTATAINPEEDESTHAADTNCISTMLRFASGSDAIVAVTGFIPEVNWTSNVRRVPLLEVSRSLSRSFEFLQDGRVHTRPGMKEQAYESAKALLHMRVQRLCANVRDDPGDIGPTLGSLLGYRSKENHALESTLQVLDAVFNGDKEIPWEEFSFSDAHYGLLSYILRCRAWDTLRVRDTLTRDVSGFVQHAFSRVPLPPPRVIADCLLIVKMSLGILPELDDRMLIKDKSPEIDHTLRDIFQHLRRTLEPHSPTAERRHAINALELIMPLKMWAVCSECYTLFRTTMESVNADNWLWHPAELLLAGAFKWDENLAVVEDPSALVNFLQHCLLEQEQYRVVRDKPIENIFCALAAFNSEDLKRGLANVDFTQPLFINGFCLALRNDAPYRLRRGTVALLRHLGAQLFAANTTVTDEQARELTVGWSNSARESWDKKQNPALREALISTLMGLLDSPFWRGYIPIERWDFLNLVGGADETVLPPSFYRCLKNTDVLPHLDNVRNRSALTTWIAILWIKYPDLSRDVKTQLERMTEGIARGPGKNIIHTYVSILEGEMERVKRKIGAFNSWSFSDSLVALRARYQLLEEARKQLGKVRMSM